MVLIETYSYHSPFGEMILGSYKDSLCLCDWKYRRMRQQIDARIQTTLKARYTAGISKIISLTIKELEEYFLKDRSCFDIPLKMVGTEFQQKVWKELLTIPYGKTSTYLELSKKLGNEKAIRAVAGANGANAMSIIIPCHRIIGTNGELTGYAGGLQTKKRLLFLEKTVATFQGTLF